MFGMTVLVYLLAAGTPAYLLHRFHSQAWYWHALAVLGAVALGLLPTPADWKAMGSDLAFGFTIIFLLVWGMGGLAMAHSRPRPEKHA